MEHRYGRDEAATPSTASTRSVMKGSMIVARRQLKSKGHQESRAASLAPTFRRWLDPNAGCNNPSVAGDKHTPSAMASPGSVQARALEHGGRHASGLVRQRPDGAERPAVDLKLWNIDSGLTNKAD